MQANVLSLFSLVSSEVLGASEPVVLLALGALLLVASFGGRVRRFQRESPVRTRQWSGRPAQNAGALSTAQM